MASKKQNKKRVQSEAETRHQLFEMIKLWGGDPREAQIILEKYDKAMKASKDPVEQKQIAYMGLLEIHNHYGIRSALIGDGIELAPAREGWEDVYSDKQKIKPV